MPLTRRARRAYLEARHQRVHGEPSGAWECKPGSVYDLEIWMTAFDVAAEEDVSPWDALLLAVRRRAGKVRMVERVVQACWDEHHAKCQEDSTLNPDIPPPQIREWMKESRDEERLMARSAKMAIDAGVADALIRRMELEGRLAVDAMIQGLDVLDLSTEDRMKALAAMHRALARNPHDVEQQSAIEGVVTDSRDEDDD